MPSTVVDRARRASLRQIKDVRGIRRFMRRGRAACDSEWKLICGTHNLLKLYRRARLDPSIAPYSRMAVGIAC